MSDIRRQGRAEIIRVMLEADARGEEPSTAAETAFPGAPDSVIWGAWSEFDDAKTNAWWETLERTIDGEVIRSAVVAIAASDA